jgi:ParB-like chromosome segregation protein Spo0J
MAACGDQTLGKPMTPEQWLKLTDGGAEVEVPDMESIKVDPETIAIDPMNMRQDQPLDLEDLERSVAQTGVVEDPVCRVLDEDAKVKYGVIQGQRRVLAAQNMQLDEIRISVGDFDDETALKRSITENLNSTKLEVATKAKAAAILKLWRLIKDDDETDVPKAIPIGRELGIPTSTASNYIEPLKDQYRGTAIDPRVNEETNDRRLSEKLEDISAKKLEQVRQLTSIEDPQEAEELILRGIEDEFSKDDWREVVRLNESGEDLDTAYAGVKESKKAAQQARAFTLSRMRFGGGMGGAIRKAARATGKDEKVVVKDAVGYFLREEGYL